MASFKIVECDRGVSGEGERFARVAPHKSSTASDKNCLHEQMSCAINLFIGLPYVLDRYLLSA